MKKGFFYFASMLVVTSMLFLSACEKENNTSEPGAPEEPPVPEEENPLVGHAWVDIFDTVVYGHVFHQERRLSFLTDSTGTFSFGNEWETFYEWEEDVWPMTYTFNSENNEVAVDIEKDDGNESAIFVYHPEGQTLTTSGGIVYHLVE